MCICPEKELLCLLYRVTSLKFWREKCSSFSLTRSEAFFREERTSFFYRDFSHSSDMNSPQNVSKNVTSFTKQVLKWGTFLKCYLEIRIIFDWILLFWIEIVNTGFNLGNLDFSLFYFDNVYYIMNKKIY